ncbi:MAG: hypothetical protein HY516_01240 [Candidatus Aenigmarchaeota archaeon]|nr:hypothetical protein [Candidatus Aenigmarchaeota archaeon]
MGDDIPGRIGKLTDALVVLLTLGLSVSQYFDVGTLQSLMIFDTTIFFVVLYFSMDHLKEVS